MSVHDSGASTLSRIVVAFANLLAFAALAAVLAFWGWRWFGPATDPHSAGASERSGRGVRGVATVRRGLRSDRRRRRRRPSSPVTRGCSAFSPSPTARGRALFRFADGSARLVAAGESLSSGTTLVAVRPDGVTIRDAGGERAIALRAQPGASAPGTKRAAAASAACTLPAGYKGPVVRLNAELVQGLIAQPQSLRAIADAQDGALVIRDEAGFAAMLGMKKGDRVTQANGIALRAPDDVIVAVLRPLAASQPVRLIGSRGSEARELMILNASVCPG